MASDSYAQPKRALSGGFTKDIVVAAAGVTQVLVACPQTTPSDHPKKHTIHVQRLTVEVTTTSATKTWTIQDANGSPVLLTGALDMSAAVGTKYTYDFGPQGFALTLNTDLKVAISAAGAAGIISVEGFYARDTKNGTYLLAVATPTPVSPVSGPAAGGTRLRVFGQNFRKGCAVTVGGVACTNVAVYLDDGQSGASLDCTTGAHAAGAVDVVVTNPDTVSVTAASAFTFI